MHKAGHRLRLAESTHAVKPASLHEQLQPLVGKKCDMRHHEGHWILVFNSKDTEAKGHRLDMIGADFVRVSNVDGPWYVPLSAIYAFWTD